ncbi:MAG TPA: succinate dehydrogenase, hydrophobic membrane anchor protein, partial [Stellaceae bacterium]|nr:succinate dehydrogenase, hydrophobic membrane anchor protein [Stellaceae bacterium]
MAETPLRSPLGRAIGLGSAKEGVEHWWRQRITGLALVPLVFWFVVVAIELIGADRTAFVAWVRNPIPAMLLILLIAATFYHAALGLQVVIEDYVHGEAAKLATLLVMRL